MALRRTFVRASSAVASIAPTSSTLPWQEIELKCSDGAVLAAQRWKVPESAAKAGPRRTVLCIHGWMDNCRSFYKLAPRLAAANFDVVAFDTIAHGWSSHKPAEAAPTVAAELAFYTWEAMHALKEMDEDVAAQEKISVIGHSLGAGSTALYTAAFPETVKQCVLLEGGFFVPGNTKDTALEARKHFERRRAYQLGSSRRRIHPSLDAAVQARQRAVDTWPGDQWISYEASEEMVLRATHLDKDDVDISEGIQFRHDPRIAWPEMQHMTWEQSEGILQSLEDVDLCLLKAEEGWPFAQWDRLLELSKPRKVERLPGSHHFHADPDSAEAVADAVIDFLNDPLDE